MGSHSSSNTEELLRPEEFNHIPPDVFGSDGFFKFAMEVPLDYEFPVAQWEGNVEDHVFKFNSLMRHSVPLLWRGGVKHCHGLKLPKVEELAFGEVVAELLVPHKLQSSAATINVKSAKIGEVSLWWNYFQFEACIIFKIIF